MVYYNVQQIEEAIYNDCLKQCNSIVWIENTFKLAWQSFKKDGWKYDGATFVREHNNNFWEVAAFIHDWLNGVGYVGTKPDLYFIKIMKYLDYSENFIFERSKWMQWTNINYLWHWLRMKSPKNDLPEILIIKHSS